MNMKKILSLLLAVTLSVSAASCSKNESVKPDETPAENINKSSEKMSDNSGKNKITVFYDQVKISDTDLTGAVPVAASSEKFYCFRRAEEYSENPEISGFIVNISDGTVLPDNYEGLKASDIIYRDENKLIYTVPGTESYTLVYENLSDGSRKTADISRPSFSGTDSEGNIYIYTGANLIEFNSSLETVKTTDIYSQFEKNSERNRYIYDMCVASDGHVYFAVSEKYVSHSIYTVDDSGVFKDITGEITDLADYVNGIFTDRDGNIVLSTGYGTVLSDVIDPATGKTVYMYENYGAEDLIGPSEEYDLVYVKSDGIYGYDYKNDSETLIISDDMLPELSGSYNSAYCSGGKISLSLEKSGSSVLYETDRNTGETIKSECSGCECGCVSPEGIFYYVSAEFALDSSDDGYTYEKTRCSVYRYEGSGTDTLLFTLPEYEYEVYPDSITVNNEGEIMISYPSEEGSPCILVYNESGVLKNTLELSQNAAGLRVLRNEQNDIFTVAGNDSYVIYETDTESGTFTEKAQTDMYGRWYSGCSGYDLFCITETGLYGWKSGAETEELVLWADTDGMTADVNNCLAVSDTEILCSDGILLKKADEEHLDELNSREILTLAVSGTQIIKPYVTKFNRENDKCRILLKDYSKYGTSDNYLASGADTENLVKDILNNDIPDIIMFDNMDMSSYILNGMFADLKKFADSDPDFDLSDRYSSVLDACTFNGCLYAIPAAVSRITLLTAFTPEKWDYDEFVSSESGDKAMFSYYSSFYSGLADYALTSFISDYVNPEKGECDFENEKFASLLRFIKENGTPDDDEDGWDAESDREYLMKYEGISTFDDYINACGYRYGSETYSALGWPSENGGKNYIYPYIALGITDSSESGESAWEFVKYVLSQELPDEYGGLNSTSVSVSEKNTAMYVDSYLEHGSYTVPEDIIQDYRNYLEMPSFSDMIYLKVKRIIKDETDIFFAGGADAEETAKSVQNKVKMYLSEIS